MGAALVIESGQGDLAIGAAGIEQDEGLVSLVLVSLLSDARARAEDLAASRRSPQERDVRGWWADTEADRLGSRLWLLEREKQTQETLARAADYTREALAWMVDEGICERVEVTASWRAPGQLHVAIELVRGRATRWPALWTSPVGVLYQSSTLFLEVS